MPSIVTNIHLGRPANGDAVIVHSTNGLAHLALPALVGHVAHVASLTHPAHTAQCHIRHNWHSTNGLAHLPLPALVEHVAHAAPLTHPAHTAQCHIRHNWHIHTWHIHKSTGTSTTGSCVTWGTTESTRNPPLRSEPPGAKRFCALAFWSAKLVFVKFLVEETWFSQAFWMGTNWLSFDSWWGNLVIVRFLVVGKLVLVTLTVGTRRCSQCAHVPTVWLLWLIQLFLWHTCDPSVWSGKSGTCVATGPWVTLKCEKK